MNRKFRTLTLFLYILIFATPAFGQEIESWQIVVSKSLMNDEAVKVVLNDLQETGKQFDLQFEIVNSWEDISNNSIIVGDESRNEYTANLVKKGTVRLNGVDDPEGYEIVSAVTEGHRVVVVAGGSTIGDVYGLYWIWDRIRVYKNIPELNVKREPSLKIRYTRIQVKSKEDIRRALRWGLNLVYGESPLALIPWDSEPERTQNKNNRIKTKELIEYAHSLNMKYLPFGTEFTYHPSLLKKYNASLSPSDPLFWDAVQAKYRLLMQAMPELDGVAVFTGEEQSYWGNYKTFDPMHDGENCDWSLEKRYRVFVKKVYDVVVGEFGKIYHHRTWITNSFEQHSQPEIYQRIFTDDVPTKNLYLIPSFTQNDRWWHQRYNPTFNLTPHNMLVVMESMNYYESSKSNIFPTFPGYYFQSGLRSDIEVPNSNLKGLSFDMLPTDDYKSKSLTSYTVFRLGWNYLEDPEEIVRDFCSIHFGRTASDGMAEIYSLSPVAYKYGLFIEPVAYGGFNSLPQIRVGTFPALGYPHIDNGKAHIEFLRKIYLSCKPWITETLSQLDHGLETANTMNRKYKHVKSQIADKKLADDIENQLKMTRLFIKTNNLYVKTAFAYFEYIDKPTEPNRRKLSRLYDALQQTRSSFMETPGFGYKLFGVDQLLINVEEALNDLITAKQLLKNAPSSAQIEKIISEQQKIYVKVLKENEKEAVKILHWEGRVDGRDIIKIKGEHLEIEHLRWDPMYFKDYDILNPLPKRVVTVIPKDIESRPMHPFILEQPSKENNYTVKVYLYDVPGGAGWCKFDLYYISKSPEELGLKIPWQKK
ncbi:hypothetical protein MNBD_IGNAVI01-1397 [hydrothermal vent metagenome]|uniref:Alpha glucuronidase N-terminal domain-containing protein n=1 Tax=hydrothermal vent metagenome TaxID=652676 RepID=A0A3B1CU45_9ZZZZ